MKLIIQRPPQKGSQRRGAIFHYYLAYVSLTSSILLMAGVCLHTILQSDQTDRRIAMFLNSLRRCEQILRDDSDAATISVVSDSSLMIARNDEVQIQWAADRGIVTRSETLDGATQSSDRFVFPAGSRIEMQSRDDGAIVVRFIEPSAFVKYSAVGSGGLNRHKPVEEAFPKTPKAAAAQPVVEIVLQPQVGQRQFVGNTRLNTALERRQHAAVGVSPRIEFQLIPEPRRATP